MVEAVMLWNEPNNLSHWDFHLDPDWKIFAHMTIAAAREIRKVNPQARFIPNAGGGALSDLDMKTVGEMADTLFADRQARHGLMAPWAAGKNAKEYAATLGNKAIAGITSVGVEEAYRWKDSVQSGDEIRLWIADGVAHNLRPWVVKFNAKPIDKRWMPVVENFYGWHYRNQKYLRNEFATIHEYNAQAGEVAEPFQVLVVANFPTNFSEAAARKLVSIGQERPATILVGLS